MRHLIFILVCFILFLGISHAQELEISSSKTEKVSTLSPEERARIFQEGISAYRNQEFELAEGYFRALISDGLQNGELYYNLANSQFRQGMLGFSMAHYLKAQEFMPRDGDLSHNLRFARKQTKDKIEPASWHKSWTQNYVND